MPPTGNLRDPDWEPTEAEHQALMEDFRRTVLWQKAMAAKGVKVLALGMTPEQEGEAVRKWWRDEGAANDKESPSR